MEELMDRATASLILRQAVALRSEGVRPWGWGEGVALDDVAGAQRVYDADRVVLQRAVDAAFDDMDSTAQRHLIRGMGLLPPM